MWGTIVRDFKAGRDINVEGDVNIIDNSNQPKLLVLCTNADFQYYKTHLNALLVKKKNQTRTRLALAWMGVAVVLGVASIWLYFDGKKDLATLVLGLGGVAAGLGSVKVLEKPNDFEQRQINALYEIRTILKERGAER